jgi:hypothetical protein
MFLASLIILQRRRLSHLASTPAVANPNRVLVVELRLGDNVTADNYQHRRACFLTSHSIGFQGDFRKKSSTFMRAVVRWRRSNLDHHGFFTTTIVSAIPIELTRKHNRQYYKRSARD